MWNGKIEKLEPGQFVTGRNSLSSDTGISPSTVEDILNVFESEQQIRQQKNNKFRLLTVLNWKEYQDIRQQKQQQSDSKPTSSRHLADTFKNVKNERIKELKNTIPPTIDELREYIKEKNYNINPEKFMAYYESNGWMVGRNKMKSWKAALVTWSHSGYNKPKQSRSGVTMISNRTETKDESIKILKELIAESKDEKEIADYKKMLGELEHEENK